MSDRSRRFWSQAILVLATAVSLALAERVIIWLTITSLAVLMGWYFTVRHDRPLMSELASRLFVLAAFLLLIYEYFYEEGVPVLALAHFMLLVCACKFLEKRTLRDDAQVLVLTLLLLVVTSIVSGNVIYPVVLVLYMTVGLDALIRVHTSSQRAHALRSNEEVIGPGGRGGGARRVRLERVSLMGMIGGMGITSTAIGVIIFIVVPRTGAGVLDRWQSSASAGSVSGFADRLDLNRGSAIQSSNETVMRVQISYDPAGRRGGGPREDLYFRGVVLHQYREHPHAGHHGWGWVRRPEAAGEVRQYDVSPPDAYGYGTSLIPWHEYPYGGAILVQKYWLEPDDDTYLFAKYPAVEIASENIRRVEMTEGDHVLQGAWKSSGQAHYVVRSPEELTPETALMTSSYREGGSVPAPMLYLPEPPLPDEQEIRALIEEEVGELEQPEDPESCWRFARAVERFLRSGGFTYTLENPRMAGGVEPVGEFLLRTRRGHCEYSASAMAVICQLNGLPARVVSGYRGGEYNEVGDFYIVRKKHAHAWVEVYVPGFDWIRFDPTPPAARNTNVASVWWHQIQSYIDYLQFQWANLVVSYDSSMRSSLYDAFRRWLRRPAHNEKTVWGAIWSFVRELFGWRLELSLSERLIYWVFTLLVLALVVLVSYVMLVLSWWAAQRAIRWAQTLERGYDRRVEFYLHYRRLLKNLGLTRGTSQTPAEFARELAARYPALSEAPLLVNAYYDVAYGRRELVGERRQVVEAFLEKLHALRREDLP